MPKSAMHGFTRVVESWPIVIGTGTSAADIGVTDFAAGFRRQLEAVYFWSSGDGAGSSASRPVRVIKNAATVAASHTLVLAETDTATKGTFTAFALSTTLSDYQFYDSDTLSIDVTAAGTQFSTLTGRIVLVWKVRPQQ